MALICVPPMHLLLALLGFLLAAGAGWRGARLLVRGLRQAEHPAGALWVVRGIRGGIVALGLGALSGGVLLANKGFLVFGAIFLAEELYETGVVLLALRARLNASPCARACGRRGVACHSVSQVPRVPGGARRRRCADASAA